MNHKLHLLTLIVLIPFVSQAQLDFSPATYLPGIGTPRDLAVGDFNGDGKQDLLVTVETRSLTYVMYSNGDGTFTRKDLNLASGGVSQTTPVVGDLNKDGKDDIMIADQIYNGVGSKLIIAISTGTDFAVKTIEIESSSAGSDADVYDFDGDGNKDIVHAYSGLPLQLYKGDGAGNFVKSLIPEVLPTLTGTFRFKVADINKDQKPDLVFLSNDRLTTFTKNSDAGYTKKEVVWSGSVMNLMIADFSGDNFPDVVISALVLANGVGQYDIKYFVNDGQGVFATAVDILTPNEPYRGLDHADYDGDGLQDLLVGSYMDGKSPMLLRNQGGNAFEDKSPQKDDTGSLQNAMFVNLDGTGKPEIVTTSTQRLIETYKHDGTVYKPFTEAMVGAACQYGQIYDLNNDGYKDIIGASGMNGAVAVWYGKGEMKFADPIYFQAMRTLQSVAVADFNGDNYGDIVYGAHSYKTGQGTTAVLLSTGAKTYATPKVLYNGGTSVLSVADLNNDNKIDIVTAYQSMINDGAGNFTFNNLSTGASSSSVATIHFDGDAFLDIAFGMPAGKIYVGINTGTGNFGAFQELPLTGPVNEIRRVNLNGDNIEDLVGYAFVTPNNTPDVIALTGNGASQFTEAHITPSTSYLSSATAADLNNDGITDIVSTSGNGSFEALAVYKGKAGGGYESAVSFNTKGTPDPTFFFHASSIYLEDMNNDGKRDAVMLSVNGPPVVVMTNELVTEPTIAPTAMSVVKTDVTATISLQKGNGSGRLIMIRKDPGAAAVPTDGTFYGANTGFGLGGKVGTDNSVVMRSNETSVNVTGLTAGTTYVATAFEYNSNSKGTLIDYLATSATTTFTTLKIQTITIEPITSKAMGPINFLVEAKSSANLPVVFSLVSGSGSLSGDIFTPTAAGPVKIKATQAGNSEYAPASAEVTFCVLPLKPTITIANPSPGKYTLTSSSDTGNKWYLNNSAIAGATTKTHEPKEDGIYKVSVTVDGCENFSESTAYLITGVKDDWNNFFTVYPNPASSLVRITHPQEFMMTEEPMFFNAVGSMFRLKTTPVSNGIEVNTEELHQGLYIIKLQGQRTVTLKMIKQ